MLESAMAGGSQRIVLTSQPCLGRIGYPMISSNDFRPGVTIEYNNGVWQIVEAMHVKPVKALPLSGQE